MFDVNFIDLSKVIVQSLDHLVGCDIAEFAEGVADILEVDWVYRGLRLFLSTFVTLWKVLY